MQWCNIFEDPDTVGESVYLAIHNAVGTMTFGCDNPNPAVNINKANANQIIELHKILLEKKIDSYLFRLTKKTEDLSLLRSINTNRDEWFVLIILVSSLVLSPQTTLSSSNCLVLTLYVKTIYSSIFLINSSNLTFPLFVKIIVSPTKQGFVVTGFVSSISSFLPNPAGYSGLTAAK